MTITFYDAPPVGTRSANAKTRDLATQLMQNPNKWMKWPSSANAHAVRKSLERLAGAGAFDVRSRSFDGKREIWVSYVGA